MVKSRKHGRNQQNDIANTEEQHKTKSGAIKKRKRKVYFVVCEACGQKCDSLKKLKLHRCSSQKKECPECHRKFSCLATLRQHTIMLHTLPNTANNGGSDAGCTTCTVCRKTFASKLSLVSHMRMHDDIDGKKPTKSSPLCGKCGKFFSSENGVEVHTMQVHDNAKMISEYIESGHKGTMEGGVARITCPVCGENYRKFLRYLYHVKAHLAQDSCKAETGKQLRDMLDRFSSLLTRPEQFACKICTKLFSYQSDLVLHMHQHKDTVYECPHCDKVFYASSTQRLHLQTHKDRYNFVCSICNTMFMHESRGRTHCKSKHAAENAQLITVNPVQKSTDCSVCNKTFPTKYNLKVHMRTHTKEKLYKCAICGKAYTDLSNLNHHGKHKHPDHPQELFRSKRKSSRKSVLPKPTDNSATEDKTSKK